MRKSVFAEHDFNPKRLEFEEPRLDLKSCGNINFEYTKADRDDVLAEPFRKDSRF